MKISQSQADALGGCSECAHAPVEGGSSGGEGGPSVVVADPTKSAWIVIELIDSTGAPRAGEAFSVRPPGGSPIEGTLDPKGKVRIEGIDPGSCAVSFPQLGYQAEQATAS